MTRHRRHFASRRKRSVDWGGGYFWGQNVDFFDTTGINVANFWVLWPRGHPDPENGDEIPEPDDTLVRCLCNVSLRSDNGATQIAAPVRFAVGLIAFDAVNPVDLEVVADTYPNPLDQGDDWVWRQTFLGHSENNLGVTNVDFAGSQSKAMRKFPANRGLLCVVSYDLQADNTNLLVSWNIDVRCAVKKAV